MKRAPLVASHAFPVTPFRRALWGLAACFVAACGDVPVLFFDGEGGSDGAEAGFTDSPGDTGIGDGSDDAGSADGTDDASCPDQTPPGASVCCGAVACNGNCTAMQCGVCEMQCGVGTLCCAKTNNVACRPMGSSCP